MFELVQTSRTKTFEIIWNFFKIWFDRIEFIKIIQMHPIEFGSWKYCKISIMKCSKTSLLKKLINKQYTNKKIIKRFVLFFKICFRTPLWGDEFYNLTLNLVKLLFLLRPFLLLFSLLLLFSCLFSYFFF